MAGGAEGSSVAPIMQQSSRGTTPSMEGEGPEEPAGASAVGMGRATPPSQQAAFATIGTQVRTCAHLLRDGSCVFLFVFVWRSRHPQLTPARGSQEVEMESFNAEPEGGLPRPQPR